MKREKLVVISHTEHYRDNEGVIKGWGSTVSELNFLADHWKTIVHVACLHNETAPPSSLPYLKSNIEFVSIPPYGGKEVIDKLSILAKIPRIVLTVIKSVKGASEVQLRVPTGMGVFLLPFFSFLLPRKFTFWVKYAGNWAQINPPIGYAIQRWWLKKNFASSKVTINGFWKNQQGHCFSFENPCLTAEDMEVGKVITDDKTFTGPFELVFVGRLEKEKGVDRIIEALSQIEIASVKKIHFIGDGKFKEKYIEKTRFLEDKIQFYGFLNRRDVHELLKKSHFILLPSTASEGFPKVIAEAACYGVIPVVSNVGSIGHYVNPTNGFLWDITSSISFEAVFNEAIQSDVDRLKDKSNTVRQLGEKFTFANYIYKLELLVLESK